MKPEFLKLVEKVRVVDPEAAAYLETDAQELKTFTESAYLEEVMVWDDTPQGWEYWQNICEKIGQW